jgi:DNA (cytosine-5)-methyltransferase 1
MKWPVAVDLFSGMGGLSLGLRRARFRVAAAVEIDGLATETYHQNFPSVTLFHQDITGVRGTALMGAAGVSRGELDLLAGCPPCQGFSTIRTRNTKSSVKDERNELIFEFLRLVRETYPRVVLMENVPRLSEDTRYRQLCRELTSMGFDVRTRLLDAVDHGVPQRRRRLIMIASRVGPIDSPEPAPEQISVRAALHGLKDAGRSGDPAHDHGEQRSDRVLRIIQAVPDDGGSRAQLPVDLQLDCHQQSDGFYDVYGRMAWDRPAPTITGGCINPSKGRFLHPTDDRAITVREAAVLQGFPPDYRINMIRGKYAAAELVGNALPPEFALRQALPIRRALLGS